MQVLQAGAHKLLLLELDPEFIESIAKQAGFDLRLEERERSLLLDLSIADRKVPLLLFDASDPGNLGWFSRCQFYVDGRTGVVLQTPITVANIRDPKGRPVQHSLRVQIQKELPVYFRMPNKSPLNEQMVYAVLYNLLNALVNTGVGVCGGNVVRPLAGRTDTHGSKN